MSTLTDDPERQPLLPSTQQSTESSQTTENVTTTVTNDDPLPIYADTNKPDPEERAHLSTILWYTALVAAGILALVFFIKGFIDAGDVDVSGISLGRPSLTFWVLQFDFKKALKRALGGGLSGAAGNANF